MLLVNLLVDSKRPPQLAFRVSVSLMYKMLYPSISICRDVCSFLLWV